MCERDGRNKVMERERKKVIERDRRKKQSGRKREREKRRKIFVPTVTHCCVAIGTVCVQ